MICDCRPPVECGKRISRSQNNPNREYYTCVNPNGNCNFFQWVDKPINSVRRTQRNKAPSIAEHSLNNKSQIFLSVAEMTLDGDKGETPESNQPHTIWINIMVINEI